MVSPATPTHRATWKCGVETVGVHAALLILSLLNSPTEARKSRSIYRAGLTVRLLVSILDDLWEAEAIGSELPGSPGPVSLDKVLDSSESE